MHKLTLDAQHVNTQPIRYATGWATYNKAGYCAMHKHATFEIVYHSRGHGTSRIAGNNTINFQAKSVTLYPAGVMHDQTSQSEGQDHCVHLQPNPAIAQGIPYVVHLPKLNDDYVHRELRELADSVTPHSPIDRACLDHRAHAVLMRLLCIAQQEAIGSSTAAHRYAEKAFDYVAREFQRIGSLSEVAEHVGVSPDYLRHIFRECYNTSLKNHLTQMRIEHAKNLLTYSTLPAKSIAKRCGFTTARHFSTAFQERVGKPPIAFRREQRSD